MTQIRFDMIGAYQAGETRHPETVIREWFPESLNLQPESIADCWMFDAEPRADAPSYFVDVEAEIAARKPYTGGLVEIVVEPMSVGVLEELNWDRES